VIVLDTSGIIAAYNRQDRAHRASHEILAHTGEHMVVSPLVLAEVDYLATKYLGPAAALTVLGELERTTSVVPFVNDDLRQAAAVLERYMDMNLGLTDAANVVIAGRYKTTRLLTLDGHYRAIRPLTGADGFTTLPGA
jgi:predicted nucleic acid-binding protein